MAADRCGPDRAVDLPGQAVGESVAMMVTCSDLDDDLTIKQVVL